MIGSILSKRRFLSGMTMGVAAASMGQGISAIGTVVGVRLLTEYLSPQVFGEITLAIGVVTLITTIIGNPNLQALFRYYPDFDTNNNIKALIAAVIYQLKQSALKTSLIIIPAGVITCLYLEKPLTVLALMIALAAVELVRNYRLALVNAQKKQVTYAVWSSLESWLRPLSAIALCLLWSPSFESIIIGYIVASVIIFVAVEISSKTELNRYYFVDASTDKTINNKLKEYSTPLLPLALIGWVSGLGDRYIISSFLSVADAGIYAAAYGLVSRPFLLLGKTFELAFRPNFQEAVSANDSSKARRIFLIWLLTTVAVSALACIFIFLFKEQIAWLLLGEEFRSGSTLMTWIALGYALLVVSYVFERVCYAYDKTRYILLIQCLGVAVGSIATVYGINQNGIIGAAMAIPAYFAIQLIASIYLSKRSI